jgi:hypothetical protein
MKITRVRSLLLSFLKPLVPLDSRIGQFRRDVARTRDDSMTLSPEAVDAMTELLVYRKSRVAA